MMRLIGYWMESVGDEDLFLPQEFVGEMEEGERERVAAYLEAGEVFEVYRGISWCRFLCERKMGYREYSDGRWVWPEDLGHYVREHGVRLPEEFLEHVRSGVARLPREEWEAGQADLSFWKGWCRENAAGRFAERIAEAREEAKKAAAAKIEREVKKMETERGISRERCVFAGCEEFALVGLAFCGRCSLKEKGNGSVEGIEGLQRMLEGWSVGGGGEWMRG